MDASKMINKILSDAKDAASATLSSAGQKADELQQASMARQLEAKQQMEAKAGKDIQAQDQLLSRMAALEERKLLLRDKRAVLDKAFALALEKLEQLPANEASAYLRQVVCGIAEGDEAVLGGERSPYVDSAFVQAANAALKKAGKPDKLTLLPQRGQGMCGLKLRKGETETDCSFTALLASQRLSLETEVSQLLFEAGETDGE